MVAATVICPDRPAKPVRVIGQGDQERRAPLPEAFGQVFGFWLKDSSRHESLFARAPGQQPMSSPAARTDRRGMLQKAGIEKKRSPHKLRPTDATNRLDTGAERVDIQALLGHVHRATTPTGTHVDQDRRAATVHQRCALN